MNLIPISKQKIWELLHPKEAREVDRTNSRNAARERERLDEAKQAAARAHPEKQSTTEQQD